MRNEVLSANDLVHTYKGGVTALKGVNLRVFENEIVSIVGQNGSGKTTLVRHFNGLLRPTSGSVFLYGEPTEKRTVSQMSRTVGYVFQNPNTRFFPRRYGKNWPLRQRTLNAAGGNTKRP
jgi:energy-coupling factor transport system ATP-binding protein